MGHGKQEPRWFHVGSKLQAKGEQYVSAPSLEVLQARTLLLLRDVGAKYVAQLSHGQACKGNDALEEIPGGDLGKAATPHRTLLPPLSDLMAHKTVIEVGVASTPF